MSEPVRYEVRTPMWLWLTHGLLTGFCVLVVAAMLIYGDVPGIVMLLASALGATSLAFWFSMSEYRVGGGRNLIRFHDDRIEVPGPRQRQPIAFSRAGTSIEVNDVYVRYRMGLFATVASVRRGKVIHFRSGAASRKLSTLTLAQDGNEAPLVEDLRRFLAGEPALGRAGHDAAAAVRTDYDDRLDRELAEVE